MTYDDAPIVIDGFLPDAAAARRHALASTFIDWAAHDGEIYKRVALTEVPDLVPALELAVGPVEILPPDCHRVLYPEGPMIREATPADIPELVRLSRKFYVTTSYAAFSEFDAESVAGLAQFMIDDGVMLVAESDGRIVGMVGLVVVPWMFNRNHKTAHEVIWWVDPEAQGNGAGKALLAAIEPACVARGARCIQMMHLASSPPQAGALYERMGYRHSETCYSKEVAWVPQRQ